ncbi:hypothetical protein L1047_10790 [Synechococcus sp. Nb3U1]|uniref:hypothetical protein n=1 Tax=Synechococcus sp. Nb3U1 TaxID=1914529 RepID=UPI001F311454|nr:hypothetical protein [Synechococcus sp. Nb3U1]MCF2971679.1 hypothetical protein [Synechococcus sp. Nb3U1]
MMQRINERLPLFLLLGSVVAGCGGTTGGSDFLPLPNPIPAPTLTITDLSPRTVSVGQTPTFVVSFRVEAPAGIRGSNAFLASVTTPLGNFVTLGAFDASQLPGCSVGATTCTVTGLALTQNSFTPTQTGSHQLTISVFDRQDRLGSGSFAFSGVL